MIGVFFNTYLYGLVTYQFISYWRADFKDVLAVRSTVMFLFLLDTVHSAGAVYMIWGYLVSGYGNVATMAVALWPYPFTPIATACAALVTQIFLGWRIFRLSQNRFLFGVIILMAIPTFALGIACGVKAWVIHFIADMPRIEKLATAWLSLQVGVDCFVTVTLATMLLRSKTGWEQTDGILRRMAHGAIQTGLFAGIFSLADFISCIVAPTTNLYGMFAIPIGRIYSNTLLDTLLMREEYRKELSNSQYEKTSKVMGWVPSRSSSEEVPPDVGVEGGGVKSHVTLDV